MTIKNIKLGQGQTAISFTPGGPAMARILAFHGGGGVGGSPEMLIPFCSVLRDEARVSITAASYRLLDRDRATLEDMLHDASRALDWMRKDGPEDCPLFVLGASFGGLLALDAARRDATGVRGLILLNAVTNIAPGGFANRVIPTSGRPEHSPLQNMIGWDGLNRLTCLLAHGEADDVVPLSDSRLFAEIWPEGRSELHSFAGARHGFFNHAANSGPVSRLVRDFISRSAP